MERVICFHLFNDYSGSPKVMKMVLEGLLKKGYRIDLVSSKGGIFDELHYQNLHRHSYPYRFSNNPAVTMLRYCGVQFYTFLLAFRWLFCKGVVFYINTLLPIGPALAGKLMGKRIVYHYHENAFAKGTFYKLLAKAMQKLANEIICVSAYQASFLQRKECVTVVPNALPQDFISRLVFSPETAFKRKQVLMLGSLKLYKSPLEFCKLAENLPQYFFDLVVNDTQENIDLFIETYKLHISKNLLAGGRGHMAPGEDTASGVKECRQVQAVPLSICAHRNDVEGVVIRDPPFIAGHIIVFTLDIGSAAVTECLLALAAQNLNCLRDIGCSFYYCYCIDCMVCSRFIREEIC